MRSCPGIVLAISKRWLELGVLVAAMAITILEVDVIKDWSSGAAPTLPRCAGTAFPSGHAAYSVIYAWLAITLVVRLRPGLTNGTAVLVFGIALTVLIGLTRIYLGVHYMSDVVSGWGLGLGLLGLRGASPTGWAHLRQNARNARAHPSGDPA